jgi:hypothetical protein
MKIKKLLVLIMAVCLSVSLFAACGSNEGTADATKAPAASATVAPTVAPTIVPTSEPTEAPTPKPFVEDPAVDAILYRFHHADKYMWEVEEFMTSEDTGIGHTAMGAACNYWHEEDEGLAIEIHLTDPYFMILGTESGEAFNLADYPVFKIRLKNETVSEKFETYVCAKNYAQSGESFQIDITAEDTEYKEYIVNFAEIKDQAYIDAKAPVGGIRMDGLQISEEELAESDSNMLYIDYFGFFKTVEDAQKWNPSHVAPVDVPETEAPSTDAANATAETTEVVEG